MVDPTVFTKPGMALAAHFPALDPIAVLQLIESPVVRTAFDEFEEEFWSGFLERKPNQTKRGVLLNFHELKRNIEVFESYPDGSCCSDEDLTDREHYREHPFASFMSRIYVELTDDYLDMPIRRVLQTEMGVSILWGILGVYLSLYAVGKLPPPHVFAVSRYTDVTRTTEAWRIRYETLQGSDGSEFVQQWRTKTAKEYKSLGVNSELSRMEKFLGVLDVLNQDNTEEYRTGVLTLLPSSDVPKPKL
ncbi:hypothetical protein F5Y09DRAFT_349920 [Xylaria sp. FL1042]|nr:hypothetical protein F5Y09DRAFT_349920 [Xylaria sp. FL1042]